MQNGQSEPLTQRSAPAPLQRALLEYDASQLSAVEQRQIRFVRKTFESGPLDRAIRVAQRVVGSTWIDFVLDNLRHVQGLEHLPPFDPKASYICVANHRSFFDLYVVTAYLVRRGMPHRLMFPVRSKFFYDAPLGLAINGLVSFFAMYPPIFRERSRAALNLASLDEVTRVLRAGGSFVGLHPEGQRSKGDDPYELLPAQGGVGRIIQASGATVIPVFVNGLGNDFVKQVGSNFTRTGAPVTVTFGPPVDFGNQLAQPPSPRLHKKLSEQALDAIRALGEADKALRASLGA